MKKYNVRISLELYAESPDDIINMLNSYLLEIGTKKGNITVHGENNTVSQNI